MGRKIEWSQAVRERESFNNDKKKNLNVSFHKEESSGL